MSSMVCRFDCLRLSALAVLAFHLDAETTADTVKVDSGLIVGRKSDSGVRAFLGIPFAAPPVGNLRWKPPMPVQKWSGPRQATEFGARCVQGDIDIYGDMVWRDKGPSEDCLYLNVWIPAPPASAKLPVMVWIYGGGFRAGGSSEPRHDGERLASKGVLVVSMNYRLGMFGFFSHPELTKESNRNASGNYGLMDQAAALAWVKRNIRRFGGDPSNVTIFGQSAGSSSVSAQMASPVARGLFHKAIGESGSLLGLVPPKLSDTERSGQEFATSIGAATLADLRARSAADLLAATMKSGAPRFATNIDGYFIPESPAEIYSKGKQARVPLLAGWNSDEPIRGVVFGREPRTLANYKAAVEKRYGEMAANILMAYPAENDEEAERAAADLATDQFVGHSTWRWIEVHSALPKGPAVFRYRFDHAPPAGTGQASRGAHHSAEIQFVFGSLEPGKVPWRDEDRKVSETIMSYWSNFAKYGDPNGGALMQWPPYNRGRRAVMHLKSQPEVTIDDGRKRYQMLDTLLR
jgi:para-nitrobenzyl esterase